MLKTLDSILLFVKDPHETAEFYRTLGFEITRDTDESCVAVLNEFEIRAHDEKKVKYGKDSGVREKGAGVFIYVCVEDIDTYHQALLDKRLQPSSSPSDQPWGNREFAIKDPDGYVLVLYQKI